MDVTCTKKTKINKMALEYGVSTRLSLTQSYSCSQGSLPHLAYKAPIFIVLNPFIILSKVVFFFCLRQGKKGTGRNQQRRRLVFFVYRWVTFPADVKLTCITQHPGFNLVCLQKWSLWLASSFKFQFICLFASHKYRTKGRKKMAKQD